MKYLLPILLFIALTSCDPESNPPPDKPYTFEAHVTGDSLYIRFERDWPKAVGCFYIEASDVANFYHPGGPGMPAWGIPKHMWSPSDGCGTQVFEFNKTIPALWHPTWIRLETPDFQDTIKVN